MGIVADAVRWAAIETSEGQKPAEGWSVPALRRAAFLLTNQMYKASDSEEREALRRVRALVIYADEQQRD